MPLTKATLFVSITPGIPVTVLIQKTVAAKNCIAEAMKPISCQRAPYQTHSWTCTFGSSGSWNLTLLWKWCVHCDNTPRTASPKHIYD
jgi:hypothetical protein